jgi:hypothetical protein
MRAAAAVLQELLVETRELTTRVLAGVEPERLGEALDRRGHLLAELAEAPRWDEAQALAQAVRDEEGRLRAALEDARSATSRAITDVHMQRRILGELAITVAPRPDLVNRTA